MWNGQDTQIWTEDSAPQMPRVTRLRHILLNKKDDKLKWTVLYT